VAVIRPDGRGAGRDVFVACPRGDRIFLVPGPNVHDRWPDTDTDAHPDRGSDSHADGGADRDACSDCDAYRGSDCDADGGADRDTDAHGGARCHGAGRDTIDRRGRDELDHGQRVDVGDRQWLGCRSGRAIERRSDLDDAGVRGDPELDAALDGWRQDRARQMA
jgi:hypothetical protein